MRMRHSDDSRLTNGIRSVHHLSGSAALTQKKAPNENTLNDFEKTRPGSGCSRIGRFLPVLSARGRDGQRSGDQRHARLTERDNHHSRESTPGARSEIRRCHQGESLGVKSVIKPLHAYDEGGRSRALSTIVTALAQAKTAGLSPGDMAAALTLVNWEES